MHLLMLPSMHPSINQSINPLTAIGILIFFIRLYRFKTSRHLAELLMGNQGGCSNHYPGVGDIEYVKDLLTERIVSHNFQCSRFGPSYTSSLGWVSNKI